MADTKLVRIIIVPGSGCTGDIHQALWYGWLHDRVTELIDDDGEFAARGRRCGLSFRCVLRGFPDPRQARMSVWLPFIRDELGGDERCILVGHSSGGQAVLRYVEQQPVLGAVVASVCHSDCGGVWAHEGYYAEPWRWQAIKANSGRFLVQFGSPNDHYVPFAEQQEVAKQTASEAHFLPDRGHFQTKTFPELWQVLRQKLFDLVGQSVVD